jgi:hypothetical protein
MDEEEEEEKEEVVVVSSSFPLQTILVTDHYIAVHIRLIKINLLHSALKLRLEIFILKTGNSPSEQTSLLSSDKPEMQTAIMILTYHTAPERLLDRLSLKLSRSRNLNKHVGTTRHNRF